MITFIELLLRNRWFRLLSIIQFFVALGIFSYAALMPSDSITPPKCDYCLHFVGNVLLILSAFVATYGRYKIILFLFGLIPYSVAMELSQHFTRTRQVDPTDLSANLFGLIAGYIVALTVEFVWRRLKASKSKN